MSRRSLLVVSALVIAPALRAQAPSCVTVSSRTGLAALVGRRIARVDVAVQAPSRLPGPAGPLTHLHARTRDATIRRHLLFAAGDTVDTLRVAESLRRLRRLRYLSDVHVDGLACGDSAVTLTVATHDEWSTKPVVRMHSTSTAVGIEERNLLGTGREATINVRSDRGRVGVGTSTTDPWFLGDRAALTLGLNAYRDGSDRYLAIGRRERSVMDRWSASAGAAEMVRQPPLLSAEQVHRVAAAADVAHRIRLSGVAATSLVLGLEYERTTAAASLGAPLVGPGEARRDFAGLGLGLRRRSVDYDTLTWLLPGGGIADVPLSLEADAMVSGGRDAVTGQPMMHVDAWTGRMWVPGPGRLLLADFWLSGYRSAGQTTAGRLRGSLAWREVAPRGFWSAQLAVERLVNPDPDLHVLDADEPTLRVLPDRARLAEGGVSTSVERELRLRRLSRSWWLDGALFGAASTRWDPANGTAELASAALLGVGLRLAPTRLGRATARLDIGWPVWREADAPRGLAIGIAVSPWIEQGRGRGRIGP